MAILTQVTALSLIVLRAPPCYLAAVDATIHEFTNMLDGRQQKHQYPHVEEVRGGIRRCREAKQQGGGVCEMDRMCRSFCLFPRAEAAVTA